jgi:hypothetical protein
MDISFILLAILKGKKRGALAIGLRTTKSTTKLKLPLNRNLTMVNHKMGYGSPFCYDIVRRFITKATTLKFGRGSGRFTE